MATTVRVPSAAAVYSRPLRTGESFDVRIGPQPCVNRLTWDKAQYARGDEAELSVTGANLMEPLEMAIEAQGSDGAWQYADRLTVEPAADGTSAVAHWRIPPAGVPLAAVPPETQAEPGVSVSEVRFVDGADLSGCDLAWVSARVQGMEGRQVRFVLEREDENGNFVEVSQATATVSGGAARAGVPLQSG